MESRDTVRAVRPVREGGVRKRPDDGCPKGLNAPTSYFHGIFRRGRVEARARDSTGFFCPGDGGRTILRLGQERGPLHVLRKLRQDLGRFHLFVGEEPHGALLGDDPHLLGPSLQV